MFAVIKLSDFNNNWSTSPEPTYELLDNGSLRIKNTKLMSEGLWNNLFWSRGEIEKAYKTTDWSVRDNVNLFLDHKDKEAGEWLGEVDKATMYFSGDSLYGDLIVHDPIWVAKLNNGKPHFGISPKAEGLIDDQKKIISDFKFMNFSIVTNPAVKNAYINNSEVSKMDSTEVKVPEVKASEPEVKPEVLSDEEILNRAKAIEERLAAEKELASKDKAEEVEQLLDIMENIELKGLSIPVTLSKAKEIRENGESFNKAIRRASKMLEEEKAKPASASTGDKGAVTLSEAPKEVELAETKYQELVAAKEKEIQELKAKLDAPNRTQAYGTPVRQVKELSKREMDAGFLKYLEENWECD